MSARQSIRVLLLSALAATCGVLLAVVGSTLPAAAQGTSWVTTMTGPPQRKAERSRQPVQQPDNRDGEDATAVPRTAQPVGIAGTETDAPAEPQDGDDPARAASQRTGDGDPQTDSSMLRDGIIETGEPVGEPGDGEPAVTNPDVRSRQDADAFDRPPAGYDAVAFQIEVDPILDRRPARLARFEPYDPVGLRKGSWIIFPEIEAGAGWVSNLFRSPSKTSTTFFDVRPTIRAVTNWRVHAIELKATGLASAFTGHHSENDRAYALEARGRIDLGKRTNIETLVSHQRDQDSRSGRDFPGSAAERADILTNRVAVAVNHKFNRLSVQLRGGFTDQDYEPVTSIEGATISNAQRDVLVREAAVRASWEFKPTLFAFTEVALIDRLYRETPSDGISRDSHGTRARVGVSFGNSGRTWRGEVSVGHGRQTPEDGRLVEVEGILIDANLGWRLSELTSILATARTELNDSTTPGQGGSTSRQFSLEARHAFRRYLIGTAGLQHTIVDYGTTGVVERETVGSLGLEYFASPTLSVFGKYQHARFDTSVDGGDYDADTVRVGVKVRQ